MTFDSLKHSLSGFLVVAVLAQAAPLAADTSMQSAIQIAAIDTAHHAGQPAVNIDPVLEFAERRILDLKKLIGGPNGHPAPTIAPYQSCQQLYARKLQLLPKTLNYKPAYWDDPRNQVAVFLGTMYAPAFYFLSYTGITSYLEAAHQIDPRIELDALRHASAQQRCFLK